MRSHAAHCSRTCQSRHYSARRYARDPEPKKARERTRYRTAIYGYDPGDSPLNHTKDRYRHARAKGYRSGLEVAVTNALKEAGVQFEYEPVWLTYVPRKEKKYKPDIVLANGIVVELKGEFTSADRTKHLDVRAAHPDVDLRFVFSRAATKISKQSKTTYGAWCDYKGIRYADKRIPAEWLAEPPNLASIAAIKQLTRVGGE